MSRRPEATAFKQQRLASWQPVLTPEIVIGLFFLCGIIFIPIGTTLRSMSDSIFEQRITYDGPDADPAGCGITSVNANDSCVITFDISESVTGPVHVYYELKNFYQNHRRYVNSRNAQQLMGEDVSKSDLDLTCDPLVTNGSLILNPCGLIANSFFNDVIMLEGSTHTMDETDISWQSDRDSKFKQPSGFQFVTKPNAACNNQGWLNYTENGVDYCFFYPNNDENQYLYETYPGIISPIKGVTDEHFIVWMRTAGLPNFRKLYGRINQDLNIGDQLQFRIFQNFDVSEFDGSKSIVISTVGEFGGKNPFLGIAYIVVGALCLFFGSVFLIKHLLFPRKMGDMSKLHWT